jgi:hypothetical protein
MEVTMETQYNGSESTEDARRRAGQVAERVPGALGQVEFGVRSAVTRLQTMPDSGLRLLAVASIGLGAGLRLAGAPRLATLAGLAPASIFGFAIMSRPGKAHLEQSPSRP